MLFFAFVEQNTCNLGLNFGKFFVSKRNFFKYIMHGDCLCGIELPERAQVIAYSEESFLTDCIDIKFICGNKKESIDYVLHELIDFGSNFTTDCIWLNSPVINSRIIYKKMIFLIDIPLTLSYGNYEIFEYFLHTAAFDMHLNNYELKAIFADKRALAFFVKNYEILRISNRDYVLRELVSLALLQNDTVDIVPIVRDGMYIYKRVDIDIRKKYDYLHVSECPNYNKRLLISL